MSVSEGEWRNRIVGYGEVAAGELMPNPKNWPGHPATMTGRTPEVAP